MGYAMALLNEIKHDEVILIQNSNLEVDALLTITTDRTIIGLLVVNKFPRSTTFNIDTLLPVEMHYRQYSGEVKRFGPTMTIPEVLPDPIDLTVTDRLMMTYDLEPQTIYTFSLQKLALVTTVANGTEGGTQPLLASGSDPIELSWDTTTIGCISDGYHLIWGWGANITSYIISGSDCGLTTSGSYSWITPPDTSTDWCWFLIVGIDSLSTEGGWGSNSTGTPRSFVQSGECSTSGINLAQCFPQ
jgi:hypothetical protein